MRDDAEQVLSAAELSDLYEQLRCRATGGAPCRQDGLVVLRNRGLYAWIAHVASLPPGSPKPGAPPAAAPGPPGMGSERSLFVDLCTEMLLNALDP